MSTRFWPDGGKAKHDTAAKLAMLLFVEGEASRPGDVKQEVQAGTWVHMRANLRRPLKAKAPVVMLLVLMR